MAEKTKKRPAHEVIIEDIGLICFGLFCSLGPLRDVDFERAKKARFLLDILGRIVILENDLINVRWHLQTLTGTPIVGAEIRQLIQELSSGGG